MENIDKGKYLKETIKPILEPIIKKLLEEKPEDQTAFFIEELKAQLDRGLNPHK